MKVKIMLTIITICVTICLTGCKNGNQNVDNNIDDNNIINSDMNSFYSGDVKDFSSGEERLEENIISQVKEEVYKYKCDLKNVMMQQIAVGHGDVSVGLYPRK